MSLPKTAALRVNCVPVSCMPSPESPAKRIVTRSSCFSATSRVSVRVIGRSGALRGWHRLVGSRREVQELLGEGLGDELEDVDGPNDTDQQAILVDQWNVPVAAGLHQVDRMTDRLGEGERPGGGDP